MISYLEGKVLDKRQRHVVLLVGSVGYKVFVGEGYFEKVKQGADLKVFCHLNIKEDAMELYGFETKEELELFELLITISGVGPRAALNIISLDSPDAIASAILNEDAKYMTKVSGIGLKTAQKIVIELQDKVSKLSFEHRGKSNIKDSEVIDALEALGYSSRDARYALKQISKDIEDVGDKIKEVLKVLAKK